jgi:predicted DNA-binding protein
MAKTILNIRLEDSEMDLLKQYCQQAGRTQTDVVRELIRGLKRKISGSSDR